MADGTGLLGERREGQFLAIVRGVPRLCPVEEVTEGLVPGLGDSSLKVFSNCRWKAFAAVRFGCPQQC